MTLTRTRRAAAAALAVTALLSGCTSKSDSKAEPAESAASSPSPSPTADADTWPAYTDERTGISFQLPDTPLVYDYRGFENDGMSQVGSTYWQTHWDVESDLNTTIDLTAYTDVQSKSADGKTVLAGFAEARKNEGDTSVKLTEVSTRNVQGFDATYGTLTYQTAKTEHYIRTELVQVAGEGWGLIIEVNLDSNYSKAPAKAGRFMKDLLVEVLSFVDLSGASGGSRATT